MEEDLSERPKLWLWPFSPSKKNIAIYLNMQKRIAGPYVEITETAEEARRELAGKHAHFIDWDGKRAGFIAHELRNEPELHGYIWELAVEPLLRGNHIGREALSKVLKDYYSTVPVRLRVHPRNVPAIRTYFDCGFMIERCLEAESESGPRLLMVRDR